MPHIKKDCLDILEITIQMIECQPKFIINMLDRERVLQILVLRLMACGLFVIFITSLLEGE